MSSPVVDHVRTIPLIIENGRRVAKDIPMEHEQIGGFPFKRDAGDGDRDFRSQLDDIAKRHPEFAQHLGKFQHRVPQSTAATAEDPDLHRRFERTDPDLHRRFERPFGDRFQHFGFPFDRDDFDPEEYAKQFYQQRPQEFYPQQGSSSGTSQQPHAPQPPPQPTYQSQQSYQQPQQQPYQQPQQQPYQQPYPQPYQPSPPKQNQETQTSPTEPIPPTPIYEREKGNIQQSNSTDLGQQQEPVNDRTQRSASEPPSGKGQRYTSSINIPVNQPNENMSSNHSESKERIIPIHIEGRDEPFMPKNVPPTFSQPHPQSEPMYNQAHFNRHGFGDGHLPKTEIPIPVQTEHPAKPQHHHQGQQTAHHHYPKGGDIPIPVQREFSPARQQQQQQTPPKAAQQQSPPPPPQQETQAQQEQQKPKQQQLGPIEQIQCIQKDVSNLMRQVEVFAGKPKDKQYLYLDEMLTRNMLKLDNIETGGMDSIRNARRECIRCIEKAIGVLENKAASNVEQSKTEAAAAMDIDETSQEPKETHEAKTIAEPMDSEAEVQAAEPQNAAMEAAGLENETNEGESTETPRKDQSQGDAVPTPSETVEGQETNMAVAEAVKKFENKEEEGLGHEKTEEKTEQKEEKKETKKKGKKKAEKKKE